MQTFQVDSCLSHDLTFTPDGRRLLVGAPTRVLFDTLGSEPPVVLKPPTEAFTAHAQLALDCRALVYTTPADNTHIHVWDLATDRITVWKDAGRNAKDLAISPDGQTLYVVSSSANGFGWCTDLHAFDVATGESKAQFTAFDGGYSWLTLSADGRRLAGRSSWSACVWDLTAPDSAVQDVRAGKLRMHVAGIALSADGTRLAVVTSRGLTLWDVVSGNVGEVFRSGKHRRAVNAVACSPTKPLLATGDNAGQIFLWDHAGHILTRYDWGLGEVNAICFAPDGLRCAAADAKGKVVVWDVDV